MHFSLYVFLINLVLFSSHLPPSPQLSDCIFSVALQFEIDCLRRSQDKKKVHAEMSKPGTPTPHDDLFRALLSDRERAGAFLRDHLPNEIVSLTRDMSGLCNTRIVR